MSLYFLIKKFNYKLTYKIDKPTIGHVWHFAFSNYAANLLNIAPTLLLPIIVINQLGAASAAYYYLAFMIANLLYTVAYSISQSLFAEGSYEDREFKELLGKAAIILSVVTVVGSAVLFFGASYMLGFFGKTYSQEAADALRVFGLAAPGVALYVVCNVLLRLSKQVVSLIAVNILYFVLICGLAITWAHKGLVWICFAWLIGNAVSGMLGAVLILRVRLQGYFFARSV